MKKVIPVLLLGLGLLSSLACRRNPKTALWSEPIPPGKLRAGLRASPYGPSKPFPDPAYWEKVSRSMASRFPGAEPALVWIVGTMESSQEKSAGASPFSGRVQLNFPSSGKTDPGIAFASDDSNHPYLELFDQSGFQIWLQVEPAQADVLTLIDLVLERYRHHPCVIGFGVDVEWNRWSSENPEGIGVSDMEARSWSERVRTYNPSYRLFLKHWLPEKMPATFRAGLVFIDDSQEFLSLEQMVNEFQTWGKTFAPAPVGFQFGYATDRKWWSLLADPPQTIGVTLLQRIPNIVDLYWVDFTLEEIWPR